MKEIGGYFGLERFDGREYHEGKLALNTGRNALAYLICVRNIRKLYIPFFLCDSVSKVCEREGCEVGYYNIDRDFSPVFDRVLHDDEWLYIVNFYGQISNDQIRIWKEKWDHIVFDNVQAFFQEAVPGIDTIYSCRKFFGVPDGSYLATDAAVKGLPEDESRERMRHLLGRFEVNASSYYEDFKANDRAFVHLPVRCMSRITHNLMRAVDYDGARKQRNDNYAQLAESLNVYNSLNLKAPDGAYAYPFYYANGIVLKCILASKGIYVATLWPNVLDTDQLLEKDYTENILPIPCDQRYDHEDMKIIIESIIKGISNM